jgi:hypothetical protein
MEGRAYYSHYTCMAEPNAKPDDVHAGAQPGEAAANSASPSNIIKLAAKDLMGLPLSPTDDTPTIISRLPAAAIRSEEALAGMLRGRYLAHFELLEPLGVGGMAAVVRARDTQLDRIVALKILPPEMASDPEIVRRFHQEARAAAKLDHENIARVFYCGEDQGLHFIAFELVEGENLKSLLEKRGQIPVPEAIGYMLQIATGLAHAAARGVVHRDIKPSNIIISANGRAKLVDMGLARSLDPHTDGGLTQSGVTLGTFDYISPEQALEPRDADVRSDIYSLGCTFYHMLTGQAPVPEGTAAKKLHHHQSIDPLDPRQLNPQIPDEVAGLLARMMAKDPTDRYQRPEHLVQHLIVLAQKLGVVNEVPDAVLFVDAPVLGPPRARPLLIAGIAGIVLVVVVILLGPPFGPQAQTRFPKDGTAPAAPQTAQSSTGNGSATDTASATGIAEGTEPVKGQPSQDVYFARDIKGLKDFLSKTADAHVYVVNDLDLKRDDQPPLVFQGRSLTIEPAPPKSTARSRTPPALRLNYDSQPGVIWTILKVLSGNVQIRGLSFELNAHGGEIEMNAIDWHKGRLNVENCSFKHEGADSTQKERVSSIRINGAVNDENSSVSLQGCYFNGGEDALFLAGPTTVHATNCAFGPHSNALIEFAKKPGEDPTLERRVSLTNCSAFVHGSAFQADDGVGYSIRTDHCVFSQPEGNFGAQTPGILIEQIGTAASARYTGAGNVYHNLDDYWARSVGMENQEAITSLDAFRKRFGEDKSVEIADSPWKEALPVKMLDDRPRKAFELRSDLAELRQPRHANRMIGVERFALGDLYTYPLPALDKKPAEAVAHNQEKVVDPSADPKANVYKKLAQAVDDAQPGDVILIRHNGLLREDPVQIKDANANLSIRPYPNCHPVLSISQSPDPDAALIRLHDGKLSLENLQFRLSPDKSGYRAQTVVMIVGDGQCSFSNCVATLDDVKEATPLALVTLSDPSAVMKMMPQPAQQQDPRVALSGCFVRGTGQLLAVRLSRPFELKVEDSLLVLNGSILVTDGNPKDTTLRGAASITLSHVTTYLTDHLILLRAARDAANNLKGLVLTQVNSATDCLFASAGTKALVHLEGIDSEEQMRHYFSWNESQRNAFSNYTQYLEQQPTTDVMPQPAYGVDKWKDFTNDPESRFDRVRFASPPAADGPMSHVNATDFKTKLDANLQGCGVNVERLIDRLPKSFEEPGTLRTQTDAPNQ